MFRDANIRWLAQERVHLHFEDGIVIEPGQLCSHSKLICSMHHVFVLGGFADGFELLFISMGVIFST